MAHYTPAPPDKDPKLWEIAQKRASFKSHLIAYVVVNTFLWALWYFGNGQDQSYRHTGWPWPIWTTLGWGIGLAFHFAGAYIYPKVNSVESEYDKLKKKQESK
jgi:2TM domain